MGRDPPGDGRHGGPNTHRREILEGRGVYNKTTKDYETRQKYSASLLEKERLPKRHNDNRSCCCAVGHDYQYFDQPFVCINCHGNGAESLAEYIKRKSLVVAYVPPGDSNGDMFLDATNEARLILRGGTRALGLVHRSNRSFGGLFELCDIFLDKRMSVKFDSRKAVDLQKSSPELEEADCAKYSLILTRDFFRGQAMPVDISKWITLLEDRPFRCEYLLEYNICLMEPLQAVGHFVCLYQHLEVLRKESQSDYRFIIEALTARHPSWKIYLKETRAKTVDLNFYVKEIFEHNDKTWEKPEFEDDARGALRLCLNVMKHALSKSVVFERDRQGRRNPVRKFTDRHVLVIVISVFGGLLVDFQELVFRAGYLERFRLEEH